MAGLRAAPTCGKAGCKEANGGVKPLMKGHKCPERQPSKKKRKLDDGTAATSATSQTLQSLLLPPTLAANATPSVESVLRTSATGSTPLASFQHRAGSVPGSQSAPLLISGSEPALDATLALLAFDASSGTTTNAMSEDSVPSLYESTLLAYLMGNTAACSQMPVDFTRGDGCPSPPHSSCPSPPHSSSPSPPHSSSPSPPRSGSPSPPRSNSPDMDLSFTSTTGSILSHAVCATVRTSDDNDEMFAEMDFTVDTQDMTVGMNIDNTGPVNSLEHPFYPQSSVSLYPSSETHAYTTPFVVEYAAGAAPLGMHTHAVDASFAEAFSRWPVPVPAPAVNMITEEDDDHVDWVDVDGNGGGVDVDFEYTQLPIIDDDGNSEYEDDDDDTDVDGDKYIKDDRNRGKRYWDYAPRIMRRIKLVHAKTRAFIMLYMSRPESVLARNGKALFYASPGMVSALGDSNAFSAGVHRAVKRHVKNSTLSATQALALNAQVATATRAKKEADARLAEEIAHRKALEARLVQFQLDYTAPV